MFVFLVALAGSVLLQSVLVVTEGITPEILNNGTALDTKDDDIAHFTCTSRGEPRPLIQWEKEGVAVKDKDEGIAILSKNNGSIEESHLFVAVSGNGRRGEYICVVSNEEGVAKQSFTIKGTSNKLSILDIAAICISVGLGMFFVCAIGFLLRRGAKKIKQSERRHRARTISQSSCQENGALIGDSPEQENKIVINGIRKSNTCTTSV
ncbi:vascular endothelial growth factor receptor 1-like isoform X2 [Oculina patagonica]